MDGKMEGGRVVQNMIGPLDPSQSPYKIRMWFELALCFREETSKIPKHIYGPALTQQVGYNNGIGEFHENLDTFRESKLPDF